MSFEAIVYRVLIASPGDLAEERTLIEEVIYHWNATHASDDGVVLLPVRWETHSVPELGDRPQGILNRRIVAGCDILVGAFWTRLGTPTGVSDSGTLEEIEEFVRAGKPVLLYFSDREINPDRVDLDQLKNLRAARIRLMQQGLVEQFSSPGELRWKLARHLHEQVRRMPAAGPEPARPAREPEPAPRSAAHSARPPGPKAAPAPPAARVKNTVQQDFYKEYWKAFSEVLAHSGSRLRRSAARDANYLRFSLDRSDMRINAFASLRDGYLGVELVLIRPDRDYTFDSLLSGKSWIEGELGGALEWKELDRSYRIVYSEKGFDPADRTDWPRQHAWLLEKLEQFHGVFMARIR